MFRDIPEADWRYLRSIEQGMIEELAKRINDEVRQMLAREDISEHEKRGRVYGIVHDQDRIMAACFDDWRRSKMFERCLALHRHGLLKPHHLEKLTPETQALLKILTG